MPTANDVTRFWFEEHGAEDWWSARPAFDAEIAMRFGETHARLARGEGFAWRTTPEGRLAEIIVLDQFSRQLYRQSPQAFAQDGMALVLAQEAVAGGFDRELDGARRAFLYMPFMHAESLVVQQAAVPLFAALGGAEFGKAGAEHLEVLARFGRFPKRNAALGRASTPEEISYLAEIGDRMF